MNEKFLNDRVAIVTGGGKGIGRAIGVALAGVGCKVAFVDLDVTMAAESVELANNSGGEAIALSCDVREETQVKQVVADVVKRFGAVHVLVNNAGRAIRKNLIDFTLDEWRLVMDTNVTGTFLMCKYVVPHMIGRGYGRIISSLILLAGSRSAFAVLDTGWFSEPISEATTQKVRYDEARQVSQA